MRAIEELALEAFGIGWSRPDMPPEFEDFVALVRAQALEEAAAVCESRQTPGTGSAAILSGAADHPLTRYRSSRQRREPGW
jgi:hypothetical protein